MRLTSYADPVAEPADLLPAKDLGNGLQFGGRSFPSEGHRHRPAVPCGTGHRKVIRKGSLESQRNAKAERGRMAAKKNIYTKIGIKQEGGGGGGGRQQQQQQEKEKEQEKE